MSIFGVNAMQARLASLSTKRLTTGPKALDEMARQIAATGVGRTAMNRSQRRFEAKQKRKQS